MKSNHISDLTTVSSSDSIRIERDASANIDERIVRKLLQQVGQRIHWLQSLLDRYKATLEAHGVRLSAMRDGACMDEGSIRTIEKCQQQTERMLAELETAGTMINRVARNQWAMTERLELGGQGLTQAVTESDAMGLDYQVGQAEMILLEFTAESPLGEHMDFIFRRAMAAGADPVDVAPGASAEPAVAVEPAEDASESVDGAGLVAGRRHDALPASVPPLTMGSRSRLVQLDREMQGMLSRLPLYRTAMEANLVALNSLRLEVGRSGGDRRAPERLISRARDAIDSYPRLLAAVRDFAEEVYQALESHRRDSFSVMRPAVLLLEQRAIQLVVDAGAYVLDSPFDEILNYIAQHAADAAGSSDVRKGYSGASAVLLGAPSAVITAMDGYAAGWDVQARFFMLGTPVNGDVHRRRYTFGDGSYVEMQAHEPALVTSDDSNVAVASAFFVGLASGVGVGGPIAAAVADQVRPYDAAWQGYTFDYYLNAGATEPWGTRHAYGWIRSSGVEYAVTVNGQYDPSRFPDFADLSEGVRWHRWRDGYAAPRVPACPTTSLEWVEGAAPRSLCDSIDALVQRMGQMGAGSVALGASGRTPDPDEAQAMLSVVH